MSGLGPRWGHKEVPRGPLAQVQTGAAAPDWLENGAHGRQPPASSNREKGRNPQKHLKSPPLLNFCTTWFVKRYRDEKDHDPIQFVQKLPVTLKVGAEGHGPGSESLRALTYEPTEVPDLLPGLSL